MTLRTLMLAGPARANELFARLAETSDGAVKTRERLFAELKAELEQHTSLEEQHLFPVLRRNPETKGLVADAVRDNRELCAKLAELEALPKGDEAFPERLRELQKAFRQHARDEKTELLPAVQRALSEEQVQGVAEKMEAGLAEAEQARQDGAEERRAKARQEREEAEFLARQAELRAGQSQDAERRQQEAGERAQDAARQVADAAVRPMEAAAETARQATRMATGAAAETARQATRMATEAAEARGFANRRPPARASAPSLTELFFWPWAGVMQGQQEAGSSVAARGPAGLEEVIPLGEEVLEVGKRTENRGTARIHRYVVETQVEQQVTLQSERVVVERRRPVGDRVTGEVLTEVTVEVVETAEVPVVGKRTRLREEIVVRTERMERVETVRGTVRRDEVEIQQPGGGREGQRLRLATAGR
jgi:stress response protein YsnF/hemerythrin-like domain-containing protein